MDAIGDVTAIPLAKGQVLLKAGVLAEAQGKVVRIGAGFAGRIKHVVTSSRPPPVWTLRS